MIAELSGATMSVLSDGANAAGAWLTGTVPHRSSAGETTKGKNAAQMLAGDMKALLLLNVEPEYDTANPSQALKAVDDADFVISMSPYITNEMKMYADVVLPVSPFSETSGTYVNAEGSWQSFAGAVTPLAETRPAWKVLRVLGNIFELKGFDYITSEDVRDEAKEQAGTLDSSNKMSWRCPQALPASSDMISRIGVLPIYAVDSVVRRATALQQTADAIPACVLINAELARRFLFTAENLFQKSGRGGRLSITERLNTSQVIAEASLFSGILAQVARRFEPLQHSGFSAAIVVAGLTLLCLLAGKLAHLEIRSFSLPALFINTGFMGIPLIKILYGSAVRNYKQAQDIDLLIVMDKHDNAKVTKQLKQKQELLSLRLKSIEKQESELTKRIEGLRKDVMKKIK